MGPGGSGDISKARSGCFVEHSPTPSGGIDTAGRVDRGWKWEREPEAGTGNEGSGEGWRSKKLRLRARLMENYRDGGIGGHRGHGGDRRKLMKAELAAKPT